MKALPSKPEVKGMLFVMLLFAAASFSQRVHAANTETNRTDGIDVALKAANSPLRDPFWPVGYRPARIVTKEPGPQGPVIKRDAVSDWNTAMQNVDIQGVSSRAGDEFYAVINGEVKGEGETVSVELGGTIYTWEIQRISPPGSVKLRRVSAR
jgi:hypothetical protein